MALCEDSCSNQSTVRHVAKGDEGAYKLKVGVMVRCHSRDSWHGDNHVHMEIAAKQSETESLKAKTSAYSGPLCHAEIERKGYRQYTLRAVLEYTAISLGCGPVGVTSCM